MYKQGSFEAKAIVSKDLKVISTLVDVKCRNIKRNSKLKIICRNVNNTCFVLSGTKKVVFLWKWKNPLKAIKYIWHVVR